MMMVRCYLAPSAIEGLGVFATTDIRKGDLVWLYDPRFDTSITRADMEGALPHIREFLERYTYDHPHDPDKVVLDGDEGRFMNHSDAPNVDLSGGDRGIALCDIPAGVELTCNYADFTPGAIEFQPPRHRVAGSQAA